MQQCNHVTLSQAVWRQIESEEETDSGEGVVGQGHGSGDSKATAPVDHVGGGGR